VSVSLLLLATILPLLLHSVYGKLQPLSPEPFIKEFKGMSRSFMH